MCMCVQLTVLSARVRSPVTHVKTSSSERHGDSSTGMSPVKSPIAQVKHSSHLRATPSAPSLSASMSSPSGYRPLRSPLSSFSSAPVALRSRAYSE